MSRISPAVFIETPNRPSFDGTNPGAPPVSYTGKAKDTAATGKIALRHIFDNGTMVYGSASTGYKGQAYDIASAFHQADADNPVRPEKSISFELGLKAPWPTARCAMMSPPSDRNLRITNSKAQCR